ncbi:heptaprenyl diphosphate synthase component 1 [Salipaludibacillus daqingensis]|uniref:heptaprenyl diphosphate synthase component 1 n=1 Tax=Salipaludibacillus daqingensis TaxID=3041001 RepID=UPI002475650E|nr:heptaprenyl diphosphate synthase component 1 [Salipaludibacillus daqingensis]
MTTFYEDNRELSEVFESFYRSVKHPYLNKFLEDPVIDKDQATVLFFMLKEKEFSKDYTHDCILTALLVQAALDTHERVNTHEIGSDNSKIKRQLTVLAGDYYSSLYYYVLSKLEDVSLIRVMARSIQEINESKMNIYKQQRKRIQPTLTDLKTIHASLLRNISHKVGLSEWSEVMEEFFLLKSLLKERLEFLEYGYEGKILSYFNRRNNGKSNKLTDHEHLDVFNQYIEESYMNLQQLTLDTLSVSEFIKVRVKKLMLEYHHKEQCVVEEG